MTDRTFPYSARTTPITLELPDYALRSQFWTGGTDAVASTSYAERLRVAGYFAAHEVITALVNTLETLEAAEETAEDFTYQQAINMLNDLTAPTSTLTVKRPGDRTDYYDDFKGYSVRNSELTVDTANNGTFTYERDSWLSAEVSPTARTAADRSASGYVASAEDMDGLPVGTVVRDTDGDKWRKAGARHLWEGLGPNEGIIGMMDHTEVIYDLHGPIEFVTIPGSDSTPTESPEDTITIPRKLAEAARDWLRYGAEDAEAQEMYMTAEMARKTAGNLAERLGDTNVVEESEAVEAYYLTPEEAETLPAGASVTDADGDAWVKSSLSGKWRYRSGVTYLDSHALIRQFGPIKGRA